MRSRDVTTGATRHRYANLYASHRHWVDLVRERMEERQTKPGLLQLVVKWGRRDIVEKVLTDPLLLEQRQADAVHLAFRDALVASQDPAFDVGIVELLMDHGAKSSEVCDAFFVHYVCLSCELETSGAGAPRVSDG